MQQLSVVGDLSMGKGHGQRDKLATSCGTFIAVAVDVDSTTALTPPAIDR